MLLLHLLFCHLNVLDDGVVVVFSHVDHMVDVLDLFVHVNGHGGHDFPYVFGPLLVVLFHQTVFLQYALRY